VKTGKEVARLRRMPVSQLRGEYALVTGEDTKCRHKDDLVRRIAWHIQAKAEGGLSDGARRRGVSAALQRHGAPGLWRESGVFGAGRVTFDEA